MVIEEMKKEDRKQYSKNRLLRKQRKSTIPHIKVPYRTFTFTISGGYRGNEFFPMKIYERESRGKKEKTLIPDSYTWIREYYL
jgi:hypothetical protein